MSQIVRTPISDLIQSNIAIRFPERGRTHFEDLAYNRGDLIIYDATKGKNSYLGTVDPDDLFDTNHNRFDLQA